MAILKVDESLKMIYGKDLKSLYHFKQCNGNRLKWNIFLMFICHQRRGLSSMTEGKTPFRLQCFPTSDRAETWLIDLQRGQEGLKCFWKASVFFAIVYLNSTYHMGLSAQPTIVMKAGGLRIKHGSLDLLYCHHKLCGQEIKDRLLWRVWLQSGSCSSVLSGCLDTQVEKGVVSLWKKESFTARSPDKSQYNIWSQGPDEHSRPRALGKAFPRKSPTGWCLLRVDCVSRSPALVKEHKLGLLCSCRWWAKSIKIWSLNYRCLSAAGSFQVSSSNVLLRILNKPTCF